MTPPDGGTVTGGTVTGGTVTGGTVTGGAVTGEVTRPDAGARVEVEFIVAIGTPHADVDVVTAVGATAGDTSVALTAGDGPSTLGLGCGATVELVELRVANVELDADRAAAVSTWEPATRSNTGSTAKPVASSRRSWASGEVWGVGDIGCVPLGAGAETAALGAQALAAPLSARSSYVRPLSAIA